MARDLESAQIKYQEILSKQTEAQVSQNLETERKGERFTMIEPPQPPEKPMSPNRMLILAIVALLLALALGVGAVVRAGRPSTPRCAGPGDIRRLLQVPALASIPIIVTGASERGAGIARMIPGVGAHRHGGRSWRSCTSSCGRWMWCG